MCGCLDGLFPFWPFRRKQPPRSSGASEGSEQVARRQSRESLLETPHADERLSNNEAVNNAITLHVGQETLGKENGVVEGDPQLSYFDQEKLPILEEIQKDVQPSNADERNSLTKKSEPEGTTQRSDVEQEMLPENSYDIQPSNGDLERLVIKEQHERQPRKINEVPDDVRPPVLTQDTEKQPRKQVAVQPLDVNQQKPPPMEAEHGVQLPEVIHHEELEATIQSPDGRREISEMEGNTPEVGTDVQPSNIVPENPPDVVHEQQPRKKIDKPLDDDQEEPPLVEAQGDVQTSGVVQEIVDIHQDELESTILSQDDNQETLETARKMPEEAGSFRHSVLDRERSLIDEQHQNGFPPDVTRKSDPRKKSDEVLDHVQPTDFVQHRQPRKRNGKDLDEVQSPDVSQE